ncbi:tail protein X [Roseovarius confluentis]|uniref:tail protein X n=1 Tax=Roseovarius confluentis TaxID=1852027 RepID=UPI003BAAC36E
MKTVKAKQGETLDMICRAEYGDESGYAERVFAANPGLAAHGPVLPLGAKVKLPAVAPVQDQGRKVVTLWS